MITRTFEFVERIVKVYDPNTKGMMDVTYSARKNDNNWKKHIKDDGFMILEVVSEKKYSTRIGMDEADFFRLGIVLDKK